MGKRKSRHNPKRFMLFSLSSNKPLAEKIANNLGVELGKVKIQRFSDGEIKINVEESVRGAEIFVLQSTSYPVSDNLMELLIMIDALRRASVSAINVVMPYYGYARQERKSQPREPITAKLVANMLTVAGADRIVALDLHAPQIQGFFDIPVDHLMGAPIIANYFIDNGLVGDDIVIVSPDHGGVTRARKLAQFLNAPIAIIDKRRPAPNKAEVMNIIGDVDGKTAIIIDDMIDTAGTITIAAKALVEKGAKEVYASATHAILSGPAVERLDESIIKKVVVSDSIVIPEEKTIDKIEVFTVANLFAEAIRRIYHQKSVSPLFNEKFNESTARDYNIDDMD